MKIVKLGHRGETIISWQATLLEEDETHLLVEAKWERDTPMQLGYTVFEPGDLFLETYYRQEWFSIWRVASHRTGRIKGWYCNICRPVEVDATEIRFEDMELDLFLYPDGRYLVLDEDDLDAADIPVEEKDQARRGLAKVVEWIRSRRPPFENIGPPRQVAPFW